MSSDNDISPLCNKKIAFKWEAGKIWRFYDLEEDADITDYYVIYDRYYQFAVGVDTDTSNLPPQARGPGDFLVNPMFLIPKIVSTQLEDGSYRHVYEGHHGHLHCFPLSLDIANPADRVDSLQLPPSVDWIVDMAT